MARFVPAMEAAKDMLYRLLWWGLLTAQMLWLPPFHETKIFCEIYRYIFKKRSSQAAMGGGEARPVPPFRVNEPKKTGAPAPKKPTIVIYTVIVNCQRRRIQKNTL
jgi:hypothetical protein